MRGKKNPPLEMVPVPAGARITFDSMRLTGFPKVFMSAPDRTAETSLSDANNSHHRQS